MSVRIRPLVDEDVEPVVALWEAAGLTRPWNDPRRDIARARAVWPELLLVADDAPAGDAGSRVVGSVMAGYDGHRGWLYYLATAPDRRGEGIGRALVGEAEARLRALGCPKVMLMVRADNTAVLEYYDALGFGIDDVAVRGRRLIPD
jgi:ribosomal protein S18 acetylase RimI-like enzyme